MRGGGAQNGRALNGAARSLKNDKEVVLAAVAQHGHLALAHAAAELMGLSRKRSDVGALTASPRKPSPVR